MRKVRDMLRLAVGQGLPDRQVAAALGVPHTTVVDHLRRAAAAGLGWPLPEEMSDAALEAVLFAKAPAPPAETRPVPDWHFVRRELRPPRGTASPGAPEIEYSGATTGALFLATEDDMLAASTKVVAPCRLGCGRTRRESLPAATGRRGTVRRGTHRVSTTRTDETDHNEGRRSSDERWPRRNRRRLRRFRTGRDVTPPSYDGRGGSTHDCANGGRPAT